MSVYKITGRPTNHSEITFDVYNRYLINFCEYINESYETDEILINILAGNTRSLQGNSKLEVEYIKRFLFLAWNTEYLVTNLDESTDIDLLRINNQWKCVQVYYSIYSLSEAVCYAVTGLKIEAHLKCLEVLSNFLVKTKIFPFCLAFTGYVGNTKIVRTVDSVNFPKGIRIPNPLEESVTAIQSIACCLQAEHRNRIESFEPNRKNRKFRYLHNPGYTTLFHFLYRLRIKSNYKDAEIFLADAPIEEIKIFSDNLSFICKKINMMLEIILIRKIKKNTLIELMDEFSQKNNRGKFLNERKDLYLRGINN